MEVDDCNRIKFTTLCSMQSKQLDVPIHACKHAEVRDREIGHIKAEVQTCGSHFPLHVVNGLNQKLALRSRQKLRSDEYVASLN